MRNTVILISFVCLFFSFFSCKANTEKESLSLNDQKSQSEAIHKISDDEIPVEEPDLTEQLTPLSDTQAEIKVMATERPPKIKQPNIIDKPEKETVVSPAPPIETPNENIKETDTNVAKTDEIADLKNESIGERLVVPELSHDKWDQMLRKYVSASGKVDYKGFKSELANFNAYLELLSNNPPQDSWSKNKIQAYWINAYNAFTVKTILDNYPLKSITDLDKPWDKAFIKIANNTYSLNDIEHKILRAKYFDSRIHFAVNCASFSCPKLLNRAFTEDNVSAQMQALAVAYINDPRHNKISPDKAELSQLFEWYKEDFTKTGSLIEYINKYAKTKLDADAKISFMQYNWSLNE